MSTRDILERCEWGLLLPRGDGTLPTHEYLGATAGGWALDNELHAKQYKGFGARGKRIAQRFCNGRRKRRDNSSFPLARI